MATISERLWQDAALGDHICGEAGEVIDEIESVLKKIIDRSYNGELGTSKVIDMRTMAIEALATIQGNNHD